MLLQRLLSFGLVVGVGFVLLVSLLVSTALSALNSYIGELVPQIAEIWQGVNTLVSLGVVTLLFAMIYQFLPDVDLRLRHVWVGALVTAGLFNIGKYLIGLYLGTSGVASAYGAAGSVVVLLVWVYYSAQIVLLGAEFTRAYVERFGGTTSQGVTACDEGSHARGDGGEDGGGGAGGEGVRRSTSRSFIPGSDATRGSALRGPPPSLTLGPPDRLPMRPPHQLLLLPRRELLQAWRAASVGRSPPGSSPGAPG